MAERTGKVDPTSLAVPRACLAVVALAYLPLMLIQLVLAVRQPSARGTLVAGLAAALLAARALRGTPPGSPGRFAPSAVALALSWALLAAGCVMASPWLATIAAASSLASFAFTLGGVSWLWGVAPAAGLIALAATPPLELGELYLDRLGEFADRAAGLILDKYQIPNDWQGAILRLPGRALDPRSGSALEHLAPLLAIVAAVSLWQRRGPLRLTARLVSAVFWLFAMEVARVVLVVLVADRLGIDLTVARRGSAVGLAAAGLAGAFVMSTDGLFAASSVAWRWLTIGPGRPDGLSWSEKTVRFGQDVRAAVAWFLNFGRDGQRTTPSAVALLRAAMVAFGVLLVAQPWLLRSFSSLFSTGPGTPTWLAAASPDTLPETLAGFHREVASLADTSPAEGLEFPRLWLYRRGDRAAILTVRGPYSERPDPAEAVGRDWRVRDRTVAPVPNSTPAETADLERGEDKALVVAVLVDPQGRPVPPPPPRPDGLIGRIRHRAEDRRALPTYQISAVVRSDAPPSQDERQELLQLVDEARRALLSDSPVPSSLAPKS